MKIVKGIGIFLVCILLILLGYLLGVLSMDFFYPGDQGKNNIFYTDENSQDSLSLQENKSSDVLDSDVISYGEAIAVAAAEETLCVDTQYIVIEMDLRNGTTEELFFQLPDKYIGMNRDQFIDAMNIYSINPPLSELERGFINLQVISFSRNQVIVQMNYKYVEPSKCFYLAAYDGRVFVYLEDKQTVYIRTDIMLETLPDVLQRQIIETMFLSSEEELFDFLENYSS